MKDCDGNELAAGDVVEVRKRDNSFDDKRPAIVWEFDKKNEALLRSEREYECGPEWMGWYPTEQLRLVRRKEPR